MPWGNNPSFLRTWRAVSQWTWYTCLKPDILCVPLSVLSSPDWATVKRSRSPRAWLLRKAHSQKFHKKSCGSVIFAFRGADYFGGSNIRPAGQVRNKYRRNQDLCNSGIWLPNYLHLNLSPRMGIYRLLAVQNGHSEVHAFLDHGADVNSRDKKWKVPQN